MGISDIEKQLFPDKLQMSPCFVIKRFNSILAKYGKEAVFRHNYFKKSREMWIAAAFCLGEKRMSGKDYWIAPEYIDATPDVHAYIYKQDEKYTKGNKQIDYNIEVTEWIGDLSLNEAIIKKLHNKKYPNFFTLLVYSHQPGGTVVNMEKIFQLVKVEKINIGSIWFLSAIKDVNFNHKLICLFPERNEIGFNINNAIIDNCKREELLLTRRDVGLQLEKLGKIVLKLPDLK